MSFERTLPWPPSMNAYWRAVPARRAVAGAGSGNLIARNILSADGREYRNAVKRSLHDVEVKPVTGRLWVKLVLIPPSTLNGPWDIDNRVKPVLDGLTHVGLIKDDRFVDVLNVWRWVKRKSHPEGGVIVTIQSLDDELYKP